MVVKLTSRPVRQPAGVARGVVTKPARRPGAAVVRVVARKVAKKKTVVTATARKKGATVATAASKSASKTAGKAAPRKTGLKKTALPKKSLTSSAGKASRDGIAARKRTVAKTQRLVDQAPIVVDEADAVAETRIARLRAAKEPGAPHRKVAGGRVRRSAVDRLDDLPPSSGSMLIERVSRAIERELTQIEVIVGNNHVPPRQRTEAERRARTLASLARTLREVMLLRAGDRKARGEDDDAVPRDLTQLRLELARRMDQLVTEAKAAHPEPPE